MVSHLPDADTVWAALQAAESGHLVFATLSTTSAVDTVDRIVEMFEPHRQRQARVLLSSSLRGILSQRLLPRARGRGRVPAVEALVVNARVSERILDATRVHELENEMAHGDLYGMQTFDQSLLILYRSGLIARNDALAHANEPAELRYELDRADFEHESQAPPDGAVREPGNPLSKRAVATAPAPAAATPAPTPANAG